MNDFIKKKQVLDTTRKGNIQMGCSSYLQINETNSGYLSLINENMSSNMLVCRGCELLLGYKRYLQSKCEKYIILNGLLNYKVEESEDISSLRVYCVGCSSEIGIKRGKSFYIYSAIVREKNRIITAALLSFKKELTQECEQIIRRVNDILNIQLTVHHYTLTLAQLQNFALPYSYDICILLHKEEGRLLLFDQAGIYHHLYQHCFQNTHGNALFILLLNPLQQDSNDPNKKSSFQYNFSNQINEYQGYSKQSNQICNKVLINDIAVNGKQPLLQLLSKNQLIITLNENINQFQINFLMNFLHNSQYQPLVPQELKEHLSFSKFNLKINISECKEAVIQYFLDQATSNQQYNQIISKFYQKEKNYKEQENLDDDEEEEEKNDDCQLQYIRDQQEKSQNQSKIKQLDQTCEIF